MTDSIEIKFFQDWRGQRPFVEWLMEEGVQMRGIKRKSKKYVGDYHSYLIDSLTDPAEAKAYLNAALEEEDPEDFLMALRHVVEAHGISKTAKIAGVNRVSLYKMLSKRGNPSVTSLSAILRAIGLTLRIEPAGHTA